MTLQGRRAACYNPRMDDLAYGTRNKRGDWKPNKLVAYPPVFVWPLRPAGIVRWLIGWNGHVLPWNLFYALLAVLFWRHLTPPLETMKSFALGWILLSEESFEKVYRFAPADAARLALVPFNQPGLVTIPLGFLTLIAVSLLTRKRGVAAA